MIAGRGREETFNNDYPATPFLGPPTQVWWVSYWSMNSSFKPLCELDDKQGVTHVMFSWHLCRFYVAPSPGGLGFVPAAERLFILLGLNSEGEVFAPRACMFKE